MNIGWVGTGVMGLSMAHHLLQSGHGVFFTTRTRSKAASLEEAGGTWCESAAVVAKHAQVLCIMVGYPDDVRCTVLGKTGLLSTAESGSLLIDFTTSSPSLAEEIAVATAARGIDSLDAPVSGGDVGAREARLSIMVGGTAEAFERGLPLLSIVGKTIVHQGPAGMGQHTKMMNQIVIASGMIGMCEGLLYAMRSGLDPETALKSVGGGAAASWSLENYLPRILKGDFEPGFMVEHFVKDMEIALSECKRMNLKLPGLELAHELYDELKGMGHARNGTQSLVKALDQRNLK